jgi:NAD(P)-dependent dehydrogenase (short-subunit alcohol dehydrogenase family)
MLELHVDVLIHNAGVLNPGETFGAVEAKALTQAFVTNAQGPFLLTQSMAGHLRDGGRLIAVSSGLGSMARSSRFGTPSYNISKAALNMVVRMLGFALADRRIAVLAISPGWVKTDMGGENAELEPAESVADMLKTIDTLEFDAAAIGTFRDRHGALLPW